jgi:microcystin degradation protein MlrC
MLSASSWHRRSESARRENACSGFIYDAEVAEAVHQAGVGATISIELGGKHLDLQNREAMISVDSPGVNSTRMKGFPRLHARARLWPLDRDSDYEGVHG